MTKLIEHLRRRIAGIPARAYAVAISAAALCCTLFSLYLALNIVLVTDSDGNRQMLFLSLIHISHWPRRRLRLRPAPRRPRGSRRARCPP